MEQWFCDISIEDRYATLMISDRNVRNRVYLWFEESKSSILVEGLTFGDLQGRKVIDFIKYNWFKSN